MQIVSSHGHLGGSQHQKAVRRIFKLLLAQAQFTTVAMEARLPFGRNGFSYVADVYATGIMCERVAVIPNAVEFYRTKPMNVVIEIDGKVGHNGKKDKVRDAACKERGVAVVRFNTLDIVGKKAISDAEILQEIQWALNK